MLGSIVRAIVAVLAWNVVSVSVALPQEVIAGDLTSIATTFFSKMHYVFFALLVLLDLFLGILIMRDSDLKDRVFEGLGMWLFFGCIAAALGLSVVQNLAFPLISGNTAAIFVIFLLLYGALRALMYANGSKAPPGAKRPRRRGGTNAGPSPLSPDQVTAIPVKALRPKEVTV